MLNIPILRTPDEIAVYREIGPLFGKALRDTAEFVRTSKMDLPYEAINECFGETVLSLFGYKADFPFRHEKNYLGEEFKGLVCVSSEHCVAHGKNDVCLGEIVTIDAGIAYYGDAKMVVGRGDLSLGEVRQRPLFFDAAMTVVCGEPEPDKQTLVNAPLQALKAIGSLKNIKNVLEITEIIERVAQERFNIVTSVSGHGIGYSLHEAPIIPNMVSPAGSNSLLAQTCLCPEPMYVERQESGPSKPAPTWLEEDAWAIYTNGRASHWETTFYFDGEKFEDIVGITNEASGGS